ncbi:preprotein translocase subunit YajC [Collimonas pratensis]|uniref:preprotein translocase subunit YajC n=1 Tax=Collimonas pratensis TaxID=279113 RepID=UPI00143D8B38|nr:preprotein translocase subunit YajC [Collimonas pratensis]
MSIISSAYAQTAPAANTATGLFGLNPNNLGTIVPFILMFAVLYFLMIRPQMKRQKEQKAMMESLGKGDEVVTAGGILGKITKVTDLYITLEIASGTEVVVQKGSVTTLLPKGTIKTAL